MIKFPAKPLAACLLGAAFLAGCASQQTSPTASAAASGMQKGKIVAVESGAAAGSMGTTSSGASSMGSGMSGGAPAVVTVQFADGTQSRYSVTQQRTTFKVGDPVSVMMRGDSGVIMSP